MKPYAILPLILSGLIVFSMNTYSQAYDKEMASATSMHTRSLPPDMRDAPGGSTSSFNSSATNDDYLGPASSMYYSEEWRNGKVVLSDATVMDDVKLRYNIYFRQMQFINGPDTAAFSNPSEIGHILIGDEKFIYTDYVKDKNLGSDYFMVLAEGECKMLQRSLVQYHEVIEKKNCTEETFIKCCELYLQTNGDAARQVRCNKKSVCNALDDEDGTIKEFIEGNKLKMKTREDLVAVIDYYNTLHR